MEEDLLKYEIDFVLVFIWLQTPERVNQSLTESRGIKSERDSQKRQLRYHGCVAGPADW